MSRVHHTAYSEFWVTVKDFDIDSLIITRWPREPRFALLWREPLAKCQQQYFGKLRQRFSPFMVSSKTITSCASISFWTSGSPNLSPRPLMFQVKIRNEFNRRVPLADKRHLPSGLEARCWVSCGLSYIFNISFFNVKKWISLKISLRFVPKGPFENIAALDQVLAWRPQDQAIIWTNDV